MLEVRPEVLSAADKMNYTLKFEIKQRLSCFFFNETNIAANCYGDAAPDSCCANVVWVVLTFSNPA